MTQSYDNPAVAAALLQLARIKAGISQRELAERAGVPTTMISAYERGRRQPTLPTLSHLLKGAGFDLTMRLVPQDDQADVLAALEARRSRAQRRRRDRQLDAWRHATPVDVDARAFIELEPVPDSHELSLLEANLRLTPAQRVDRLVTLHRTARDLQEAVRASRQDR